MPATRFCFRSAAALLEDLHRQSPEGRRHRLRTHANAGLRCIDEVGYLSFDDKAADLRYEIINRRYEPKSVIVTASRPFKEWNEVLPNAACIATPLDRLARHPMSPSSMATAIAFAKASKNRCAAEAQMTPPASLLQPAADNNSALYTPPC